MLLVRLTDRNKSTIIAPDLISYARRVTACILNVFELLRNEADGIKDKQECEFFSIRHPKHMTALKKYRTIIVSTMLIMLTCICLCCTNKKMKVTNPSFEKWRTTAQESKGYIPAQRKRHRKKMLPATASTESKPNQDSDSSRLSKKRITLKMHQANIDVLLRALARAIGQNIMISENVKGKISINVAKIPWDQVFMGIIKTHGLFYQLDGEMIRILTIEDFNKDFKRLQVESNIKTKQREMEMNAPLITRVVDIDFSNAGELKSNLEKFITKKSDGKPMGSIMVDEHTNSLIIHAMASDIEEILDLVEVLDRPTPQVLIEAHIVEATSETARELGVQWGGLYKGDNGGWVYPGANSSGVVGNKLNSSGIDPTSGWAVNFPANLDAKMGMTLGLVAETIGESLLAVQLSALQKEGKLNILSSPSITTLDNQTATIEAGDEVPYQTVEDGEVKVEYKKAVLLLKVTPHVIEDDALKLKIITNKDELDFSRTVGGNPTVVTKKAETNVIVFDGQTTVIGGLNKETENDSESGVPLLKDIPILGYLFKGEEQSRTMQDLLIFITPHILKEKVILKNFVDPSEQGPEIR